MWTRKDLKTQAKEFFKKNYWPSVFTSILLGLLGAASGVTYRISNSSSTGEDYSELLSNPEFSQLISYMLAGIAVVFVVAILLSIFFTNVIKVGGAYFHLHCRKANEEDVPSCKDVFWGFGNGHYGNTVKIIFLRNLFVSLWSLLFIIPGIIKAYQYAMVEYVVSENPSIGYREALDNSRDMMKGNKWKLFVLDLSFILWDLLNALTLGILGVFWLNPYKQHTHAAFYAAIKPQQEIAPEETPEFVPETVQ